jgi:hypothetical protein
MSEFSIVVQNDTEVTTTVCLYRGVGQSYGNAWLTLPLHWGKSATFTWDDQWQFVWAKTQQLAAGTVVEPGEALNANLQTSNYVTLTYAAASGFSFKDQTTYPQQGTLVISCDSTIPPQQVATGVGMAGSAAFVVMAQPNFSLNFAAPTQIWVAVGDFTQGEVLDPAKLTGAAQVAFPVNTLSMTATLNADNSWSIAPTPL